MVSGLMPKQQQKPTCSRNYGDYIECWIDSADPFDHPSFMADTSLELALKDDSLARTPSSSVNFPVAPIRAFCFVAEDWERPVN